MNDGEDFISLLERMGETEVRRRLAKGEFGAQGHKRQMVDDWLLARSEARSEVSSREQISLARVAADAARDAAREARIANTNTKIIIALTIAAIVISIITLFRT